MKSASVWSDREATAMRFPFVALLAISTFLGAAIRPAVASDPAPGASAFESASLNSLARCSAPPGLQAGPALGGAASEAAVEPPAKGSQGMGAPPAPPDSADKGKEFPRLTPRVIEHLRQGGY